MIINHKDFKRLSHTSMAWNEYGTGWSDHIKQDRFDPAPRSIGWKTAYWYSDYPSVFLAKTYLTQEKIGYEMFSDEWSGDWVIVTDLQNG